MNNKKMSLNIFSLFMVIFIDSLGWGIVYPILEPVLLNNTTQIFTILPSLQIRNFWYEAMVGLYCLCMFIMSPFLGSLSDRYGRKGVLIFSLLGMAVGFLVSGIGISKGSLACLVLGRIIAGSTAGSLPIAQAAMVDGCSENEKAWRLSLVSLANVLGFAFGPVMGGLLLDPHIWGQINYLSPFWASCLIALLGAIFVAGAFSETFSGNMQQKMTLLTGFINLYDALKNKSTRHLFVTFATFMLGWVLFFSTTPLLLAERFGWQASLIGYFIFFMAAFLGLGVVFIMPWLMKKIGIKSIIRYSLVAMLICSILFPLINHPAWLWLVIILDMAVPFTYIGLATLFSNAVSADEQGKIMGVFGSLVAFNWGVGPILAALMIKFSLDIGYLAAFVFFVLAYTLFQLEIKRST